MKLPMLHSPGLVNTFDCTIVGDVCVDIVIRGSFNQKNIFDGGTSYCDVAKISLGGSGSVAVGLSCLGGKVAFIGKAGKDIFGRLYTLDLKKNKVATSMFFHECLPTGLVIAFVNDGRERSFVVFRGANDALSAQEIRKASNIIKKSKYLYFCGYSLVNEPQRSAILKAVKLAKELNIKIVFDPGAHNLVESYPQLFARILEVCDVFSPNLEEAMAITNTKRIDEVVDKLKKKVPLTALKCGINGSILISKQKTVKIPSFRARCVDPTGAGDAFTAALIYGLAERLSLESAGKLANWFAAEVVTDIGSRNCPSRSKIDHFLRGLG